MAVRVDTVFFAALRFQPATAYRHSSREEF